MLDAPLDAEPLPPLESVTLAENLLGPVNLAVADGYAFIGDQIADRIDRCELVDCAGTLAPLVPNQPLRQLAHTDAHLIWTTNAGVFRCALPACSSVEPLLEQALHTTALHVRGDDVYIADATSAKLLRLRIGQAPEVIVQDPGDCRGILATDQDVYFTRYGVPPEVAGVFRCPLTGCVTPPTNLLGSEPLVIGLQSLLLHEGTMMMASAGQLSACEITDCKDTFVPLVTGSESNESLIEAGVGKMAWVTRPSGVSVCSAINCAATRQSVPTLGTLTQALDYYAGSLYVIESSEPDNGKLIRVDGF